MVATKTPTFVKELFPQLLLQDPFTRANGAPKYRNAILGYNFSLNRTIVLWMMKE